MDGAGSRGNAQLVGDGGQYAGTSDRAERGGDPHELIRRFGREPPVVGAEGVGGSRHGGVPDLVGNPVRR
jgi:hypothetical protein